MKKRLLASMLVLALTLSLFAACGGTESTAESTVASVPAAESVVSTEVQVPEEATEPEAEAAASQSEEMVSVQEEPVVEVVNYRNLERTAELPLVEETATLTCWASFMSMFSQYMPNGYDDNGTFRVAEELTNVHIDWTEVSGDAAGEQFNLMIAAGEYCDMISGFLSYYSAGADSAIEEEIIIPLNDYLDTYAPNYVTILDADTLNRQLIETDAGNIVSFYIFDDEISDNSSGLVIRKDWLDELGLEIPNTYDELEQVLVAFKTNFPDCENPIYLSSAITPENNLLSGGYGINASLIGNMFSDAEPWYQVDGVVKFGAVEDGFYDFVSMLNSWYQQGLIYSSFVVENEMLPRETEIAMLADGSIGVSVISSGYFEDLASAGPQYDDNYEMVGMADITLNEGDVVHFDTYKTHVGDATMCITTQCENVELAVQWLDFWYTDDGFLLANWGVEDESYVLDENGEPTWSDYYLEDPTHRFPYTSMMIPQLKTDTDNSGRFEAAQAAAEAWNSNRDAAYAISDKMTFSVDDSEDYYAIYNDIATYMEERYAEFVTGEFNEEIFEEFRNTLYDMGIQTCIDLKQACYDNFMS